MIAAIIQARTGSTRLPGKILKTAVGKTMLEHMIERVQRSKRLDSIIIATTDKQQDDPIVRIAKKMGVTSFRGSEEDVLDRYYQAAKTFGVDSVMRLTSDCPLMDPRIVDAVADLFMRGRGTIGFATNTLPLTFPEGMDVEIFPFAALEEAWRFSRLPSLREHVTGYIRKHPHKFRVKNLTHEPDTSTVRITLDYPEDYDVIRSVFEELYPSDPHFGLEEIIALWARKPHVFQPNREIPRNEGLKKSLQKDAVFELVDRAKKKL